MITASLAYHFSVMIIAIIMFFMKLTAPNANFELLLKAVVKIVSLYCMLYAGVQMFKIWGII